MLLLSTLPQYLLTTKLTTSENDVRGSYDVHRVRRNCLGELLTHTANNKYLRQISVQQVIDKDLFAQPYLRSPSIAVPASKFLLARPSRIFARIPYRPALHAVPAVETYGGIIKDGSLVVSFRGGQEQTSTRQKVAKVEVFV